MESSRVVTGECARDGGFGRRPESNFLIRALQSARRRPLRQWKPIPSLSLGSQQQRDEAARCEARLDLPRLGSPRQRVAAKGGHRQGATEGAPQTEIGAALLDLLISSIDSTVSCCCEIK